MTAATADPAPDPTCAQCGEVIERAAYAVDVHGLARHAYAADCPPPTKERRL